MAKSEETMYTFDHGLFLWLNFDGGPVMDAIMTTISGTLMWLPLYMLIIYLVWRKFGWQRTLGFVVCLALAIGFSDIICGIFKHSGPLKNVWESFPVRHRPMFTTSLQGLIHIPSFDGYGLYGTVSAHAATVVSLAWMSALVIRRRWYNWLIGVSVVLICYSRIYLACHFPMDLVIGSVVGSVIGIAIYYLWRRFDRVIENTINQHR